MKELMSIVVLLFVFVVQAFSQKYFSRNGHIWFHSSAPVEDIEAHNYQASSIMDIETGQIVFSVLIKAFQFPKALMQEHFNEKYLESDKIPKATFKGMIDDYQSIDTSIDSTYEITVSGKLSIHGVTHDITVNAKIDVKDKQIHATSKFQIPVADYGITIPSLVRNNIARIVDVFVDINYQLYNK